MWLMWGLHDSQSPHTIVPHLVATLIYLSHNYYYFIWDDRSTLNFRSPHWAFACQMESHSECPVHTLTSMLTSCCIIIFDASPTWKQHGFNIYLCLNRIATVILRFQLSIPNTQYWFNTNSATLARNWNIGYSIVCYVKYLVLARYACQNGFFSLFLSI